MLLTLKILFKPESTEGVEDKQVTAMKAVYGQGESEDCENEKE